MEFVSDIDFDHSLIPDDVTIPQFIFDLQHPLRPAGENIPMLIEDKSGRKFFAPELNQRAHHLAAGLQSAYGISESDVVLLFSRNHIDYPVCIWAIHRLGGIVSGANPDFTTPEFLFQLQETKATLIVASPDSLTVAKTAAKACNLPLDRIICFSPPDDSSVDKRYSTLDDIVNLGQASQKKRTERRLSVGEGKTKLAFLCFSSGTTGRPKAVAISHYALIANAIQLTVYNKVGQSDPPWQEQRYRPGDVATGALPFFHIYGLSMSLCNLLFFKMTLVVVPKFDFVELLKSIVRHHITHLFVVPPQVVLLCKHPETKHYDLQKYVRFIVSGAAPLSHELNKQLCDMFPTAHIGQGFGMTECCAATMWPLQPKHGIPGSSGKLLPGTIARVVKPDGSLAGYEEAGEIILRTPAAALAYVNDEIATKETFVDGWVRTGDEVKFRRDGHLVVLDRIKEMIKVRGFQVAPAELEGCLLDHPDVSNACVVGVPDDYSGELPMAFVVLSNDAARRAATSAVQSESIRASIIKHIAAHKTRYKHLTGGVEFVSSIPTSPSGKLLRRILRDQAKGIRAKLVHSKL